MTNSTNDIVFELTEKNKTKSVLRIGTIVIGFMIMISAIWMNIYVMILGLYIVAMSFLIKDRTLQVFNERFELRKKSILSVFNSIEVFEYSNIKKIEFSESYTDVVKSALKSIVIDKLAFVRNSRAGIHSKPDTIEMHFVDDSFRVINKIGTKKEFLECYNRIIEEKQKISTTPNNGEHP